MDGCELSLLMGADASLTPTTFLNCYRGVWWYRNPGQHASEKKNGGLRKDLGRSPSGRIGRKG